jgi:hypothetical protein
MITKLEDGTVVCVGLPLDGKVRTISKEEWDEEFNRISSGGSMCPDFMDANKLIDADLGAINEALKQLNEQSCP